MARSRIHESQVIDADFLSEDEHTITDHSTVSGVPRSIIELNDTPSGYDGGKYLKSTAAGTEWATVSGSGSAAGGISWTIVSGTSINCIKDTGYLIDATNNDVLLHLPTTPSEGDTVGFCDFKNMAETNTITISGSNNIEGESTTLNLNVNGAGFDLVYTDSSRGWEVVSEIGAGGTNYRYVDRGDPASWDFNTASFTTDGTWRELDCSSIVSSDATAIVFRVYIKDDAAGNYFRFRCNGNSNSLNVFSTSIQVANIQNETVGIIPCDSNQVVEYFAANTTWTEIYVVIMGWFTEGGSAGGDVCSDNDIGDNKLVRGDGGAKKIQECSTITVTNDGEMTNTGQPCFLAHPASKQENIATDSYVTIVFGTERIDIGNNFASNTFTASVDGRYLFCVNIVMNSIDTAASEYEVDLVTSNKIYSTLLTPQLSADLTYWSMKFSIVADMDANDTAYLRIYQTGGTSQTDINVLSTFSGGLFC